MVTEAFLVFSKAGPSGQLFGIYATRDMATCKVIQLKEDILGYPHISTRLVKRHELEQLLECDVTQAQFEKWGIETVSIDGVEYKS